MPSYLKHKNKKDVFLTKFAIKKINCKMKRTKTFSTHKTLILSVFFMMFSVMAWAGNSKQLKTKVTGIHQILLVKFKKSVSDSTIQQVAFDAFNLKKSARTLKSVEWGKRSKLSDDTQDYDYVIVFHFSNETNFEIFSQNPARLEFMGKLIPLSSNILKFTYKVEREK